MFGYPTVQIVAHLLQQPTWSCHGVQRVQPIVFFCKNPPPQSFSPSHHVNPLGPPSRPQPPLAQSIDISQIQIETPAAVEQKAMCTQIC